MRSDDGSVIEGVVLEVMFESSTDEYVYKYQDTVSKSVEYISVEELLTCDWKDVVMPSAVTRNNINSNNLSAPKESIDNGKKSNVKLVNRNCNNLAKRKSSYTIEVGPPKSIFDVVPLKEGLKRNRKVI